MFCPKELAEYLESLEPSMLFLLKSCVLIKIYAQLQCPRKLSSSLLVSQETGPQPKITCPI